MQIQPLKYMFYRTFKSVPKWKRDLLILDAMQKAYDESYLQEKTASFSRFTAENQGQNSSEVVDFESFLGPKKGPTKPN